MRGFKSLQTNVDTHGSYQTQDAVGTDGTAWMRSWSWQGWGPWMQVPSLPQDTPEVPQWEPVKEVPRG